MWYILYYTREMWVSKHYLWGASVWPPCLSLVFSWTIICCNYFYISVKWPLTCILIRIKAHLLEDKQISSVRVFDEAKSVTLLGGHLSPKSWLFDQILPQIVPFVILGTLEKKSGKRSILDVFGAKSEENGKVSKSSWKNYQTASRITCDGIMLWKRGG